MDDDDDMSVPIAMLRVVALVVVGTTLIFLLDKNVPADVVTTLVRRLEVIAIMFGGFLSFLFTLPMAEKVCLLKSLGESAAVIMM